jgi:formylglycine-generating enzyme required for sulfatase activity
VHRLIRAALAVTLLLPSGAAAQVGRPAAWVEIPAGTFQMGCSADDVRCDGDEYPSHAVTISQPFEMLTTEVTIGMLLAAGQAVPEQPEWNTSPDQPVVIVSWSEAAAFCEALGGRLPTEAEWEYAARGGLEGGTFPWGSEPPAYDEGDPTGAAFEGGVARPVATFGANGYGLYDMAGNVWEWCSDYYAADAYNRNPRLNPTGPERGAARVMRGGSWNDRGDLLRVSNRLEMTPTIIGHVFGFRCAKSPCPGGGQSTIQSTMRTPSSTSDETMTETSSAATPAAATRRDASSSRTAPGTNASSSA